MCAQFLIKAKFEDLKERFNLPEGDDFHWLEHVLPYRPAPVIVQNQSGFRLRSMSFSLVPHWSKTSKVKFATHNARLETVAEKPTWKKSFLEKRCLVPLSGFIEPIYEGQMAGFMVDFHRSSTDLLFAAGIYDEWTNKETGEVVDSFSIITHEPSTYIAEMGHDREPYFLKSQAFKAWTDPEPKKKNELFDILKNGQEVPDFSAKSFRELKRKKK